MPLPSRGEKHVHSNDPAVFRHDAFAWQLCDCSTHSSASLGAK